LNLLRTPWIVGSLCDLAAGILVFEGACAFGAELRPQTLRAFERYVHATEARMERDRRQPGDFLYIDSLAPSDGQSVLAMLRRGGIYVVPIDTRDSDGKVIRAQGGWIHHWLAAMFIPGAGLKQAVKVDQDYDHYKNFYKPDVVRSRLLEHNDDTYKIYLRLERKTPWVAVTLDTYSDVHYVFLDTAHMYSHSYSIRIQQEENVGKPDEHLDPTGDGSGFLWAVDVYWRLEETGGGIMAEWETIALTRTLPFGLGWILKPFVHRAAQETAQEFMVRTRKIILRPTSQTLSGAALPMVFSEP
jgi:hypothetical protein